MTTLLTVLTPTDDVTYQKEMPKAFAALHEEADRRGIRIAHLCRTWRSSDGVPALELAFASGTPPRDARATWEHALEQCAVGAGIEAASASPDDAPLWNAGLSGPRFAASSRELAAEATPFVLDMAAVFRDGGRDAAYRTAVRVMATHSLASLMHSDLRSRSALPFAGLLSRRLLSYRSHYEAIFARAASPERLEDAANGLYRAVGADAREAIRSSAEGTLPSPGTPERRWYDLLSGHHARIRESFAAGDLRNSGKSLEDLEADLGRKLPPTRFHTPPSPALERLMQEDPDFLAFRFGTSLLYSSLYTAGLAMAERYLLCHVLATANEDVSGRSVSQLRDDLDDLAVEVCPEPGAAAAREEARA